MADTKKFLNQAGVSTLWSRIADEVKKVDNKVASNAAEITVMKSQIEALEAGTYDDTEIRGLISTNADAIDVIEADYLKASDKQELKGQIDVLVGNDENKSVRAIANEELAAQLVADDAKESLDTLAEIAAWIQSHPEDASAMNEAITALEGKLAGIDGTVKNYVDSAISALAIGDYAKAADLTALAARVKVLEDAGYQTSADVDAKISALDLANTYEAKGAADAALVNAKSYADSLAANYDAAGSASNALASAKEYSDANLVIAKSYADTEIAKIEALTTAEIDAAIAAATTA